MRACESHLGLALVAAARGEWDEADRAVDQALIIARGIRSEDLVTLVLSCRTRLGLMRGEPQPERLLQVGSIREDSLVPYVPLQVPRLTEARRLIAVGRPQELREAGHILHEAVRFFSDTHVTMLLIPAMAMLALLHRAYGERGKALSVLGGAVELAVPGAFIRTFLDLGPDLFGLLYELRLKWPGSGPRCRAPQCGREGAAPPGAEGAASLGRTPHGSGAGGARTPCAEPH